jgi:two-component sensor histidine kinase
LQLVTDLVAQLDGDVSFEAAPGARFAIRFRAR